MQMSFQKSPTFTIVFGSLILGFLLGSCSSKVSTYEAGLAGSERVISSGQSEYSIASCLYRFNEGPRTLELPGQKIQNTSFGKPLDLNLLTPVLRSSAAELVRFAETKNVRFYKTAAFLSGGCGFAESLPPAPQDLETSFVSGGQEVVGLYLPANSPDSPSTKDLAAIVVAQDSNKWTLTHEYMHHLFQLERPKNSERHQLQDAVTLAQQEFETSDRTRGESVVSVKKTATRSAVAKLKALNQAVVALLKATFLEEMTIDSFLADKLVSNELAFIPESQRISAATYTMRSGVAASSMLRTLMMIDVSTHNRYSEDTDAQDESELDGLDTDITKLMGEISVLNEKASKFLASQHISSDDAIPYNGIFLEPSADKFHPCSGEAVSSGVVNQLENLAKKLTVTNQNR
jgi:hypothetical protein